MANESAPQAPRIQYAETSDGVNIAFWSIGEGIPLVYLPRPGFSHLQLEWQIDEMRSWYEALAKFCRLIRYDGRGTGLSDRDVDNMSVEAQVRDLEAVADKLGLERFAIFAPTFQGLVAVQYAVAHPERVSHLMLWCMAPRGADQRGGKADVMRDLLDTDWELYTRTVAHEMLGWPEGEEASRFASFMREGVSQETMKAALDAYQSADVTALLPEVQASTAVMYRREIVWPGVDQTRKIVAKIPNAHLVLLEGTSIAPFLGDTDSVVRAVEECLKEEATTPERPAAPVASAPGIRYAASADGTKIAYETVGNSTGVPVVSAYGWFVPALGAGDDGGPVAKERPRVLYDRRGVGSSQRDVADVSLEAHLADLRAIIDATGAPQVDLIGFGDGAAVCLAFAARDPDRVRKVVVWGSFARGAALARGAMARRMANMIRNDWTLARRTMSFAFVSSATTRDDLLSDPLRELVSQETAAKYVEFVAGIDISGDLPQVHAPVLVMHRRHDTFAPFSAGQAVAAALPDARLVPFAGDSPFPFPDGDRIAQLVIEFLDGPRPVAPPPSSTSAPGIRYCTTEDGVRIAYKVEGAGPAVIMPPFNVLSFSLNHLAPAYEEFVRRLGEGRTIVQYDQRGTGLSQRDVEEFSQETTRRDLEAVVAATGLERFSLWGMTFGALIAIDYAVRQPDRVESQVLYASFAKFSDAESREMNMAFADLARANWEAAARALADMEIRRRSEEVGLSVADWWLQSCSGETFARLAEVFIDFDATPLLSQVACPTLVLHRRDDARYAEGQQVAAGIPGARFVPLPHGAIVVDDNTPVLEAIDAFLPKLPVTSPPAVVQRQKALDPAPGISYATSADGTRIAYMTMGSGKPLLFALPGPTSIELDWELPQVRAFFDALLPGRMIVRYDMRGTASSQRDVRDMSAEAQAHDLLAVADALGLDRFDIFAGPWFPAQAAIVVAARHSDRVGRLVLWEPQPLIVPPPDDASTNAWRVLAQESWRMVTRTMADALAPSAPQEVKRFLTNIYRETLPQGTYLQWITSDVRPYLGQVRAPALILHARDDAQIPLGFSREAVAGIHGARLVPIDGNSAYFFLYHEQIVPIVREFLGDAAVSTQPPALSGVHTILFTDLASSTAITQRIGDAKAQELVRAHDSIVREALRSCGGTEIKHTGDGIMASFAAGSAALECAVAIQRGVQARNRELETGNGESLGVHIGLNAGEPVAEGGDLFGASVQLARRLCDASEGGEIFVSDVVRALALGKGFAFEDRGEQSLKGFDEPVRAWSVVWREAAAGQ